MKKKSKYFKKIIKRTGIVSFLFLAIFTYSTPKSYASGLMGGKIYLQTEQNGEAWYVYPWDGKRYFLGKPEQALEIMRKLSLGATHEFISKNQNFPQRLSGVILLDVEQNGEAYYINPSNLKKYYLGRPGDAFRIMRELGIGITDKNLSYLPLGDLNNIEKNLKRGRYVISGVPFSPQAPFANWADERQQDGCEEASALISVYWAQNKNLTRSQALEKILDMSYFTEKKYGEFRDTSAQDTLNWLIKDYFGYHRTELKKDVELEDLIYEIKKGNLIIAPLNGQTIGNIYYTPPGPMHHMMVIRGYDENRETFITNDPGVGNGEGFEYDQNIFYNSIRDYPTGYHKSLENIEKSIIVVWK